MISSKVYGEAECGRFRFRYLKMIFYEGSMGSGKINNSGRPKKKWIYPRPKSLDHIELTEVCRF